MLINIPACRGKSDLTQYLSFLLLNNVVTKSEGDYMDKLLERFLNYVSLDTQSKAGVRQVPSTEGQWKLLHLLKEQPEEMGLSM